MLQKSLCVTYVERHEGAERQRNVFNVYVLFFTGISMDTMIYLDQENGRLNTPAVKSRQNRLHSAPGQ